MRDDARFLVLDEKDEPVRAEADGTWSCSLPLIVRGEVVRTGLPGILLRGRDEAEVRALRAIVISGLHAEGYADMEEVRGMGPSK